MNINKFTQKSMEAVQNCEKLAYEYGNQQIDEQHLLYSLLTLEDSLILKLITKMGIQGDMFSNEAKQAVERLPKVSGSGQLYISSDLNKVLISGEDEAKAMGDEYVSVEHLFLSLLKHPNKEIKALFKLYNITRETFLQALSTVRGNQRVVSDNPEATYDTLAKYGYDLVERAGTRSWTRLSAVTARFVMLSVSSPVRRRTTRCLSVSPAWARQPWWKVWPRESCGGMSRTD